MDKEDLKVGMVFELDTRKFKIKSYYKIFKIVKNRIFYYILNVDGNYFEFSCRSVSHNDFLDVNQNYNFKIIDKVPTNIEEISTQLYSRITSVQYKLLPEEKKKICLEYRQDMYEYLLPSGFTMEKEILEFDWESGEYK